MLSQLFGSLSNPSKDACQEVLKNCRPILFSKEGILISNAAIEECQKGIQACLPDLSKAVASASLFSIIVAAALSCCCAAIAYNACCCVVDCIIPCRKLRR
jgi:hypothetical protein